MTSERLAEFHASGNSTVFYGSKDRNFEPKFEQFLTHSHHQTRIEKIARKYTQGTSISWEDAAQTAYIKVIEAVRAGKFRHGGIVEFYRWATTVARFEIIDLIRKEKQRHCISLDQPIAGTNLPLSETIADDFNLLDTVERTDLMLKALDTVQTLDHHHPDRHYLQLWQGQVQGKRQTELAVELGLTQSAVSKRWKELVHRIAEVLGLLQVDTIDRGVLDIHQKQTRPKAEQNQGIRRRSKLQW